MAATCIYTLEPLEHGGVIAKVREVIALHNRYGHEAHLLYTATNQVPTTTRWDKLRYFLRTFPGWQTLFGFNGYLVPDWPMPLWASYAAPALAGLPAIASSQMHVVVSGSNHCGLPAALWGRKYVVWIGTLYEEELEGRVLSGDAWAKQMLASPARGILAREEKFIFEHAALILSNGSHTADEIKRTYPAVAERVRVMIYPVDTDTFHPAPPTQPSGRKPFLLFTARINDPRKNTRMLFRAFGQVRAKFPDLQLVLTGDEPDPLVRRWLDEAGVAESVRFAGYQSREALAALYQQAELFVLPSSQEGLGISMLEALASGLPVVSTRCGGPESVIEDGLNGRLVPNGDEAAFAGAIIELLSQPERLQAMRADSVAHARANFSRSVIEGRLLEAFETVYPEYFAKVEAG